MTAGKTHLSDALSDFLALRTARFSATTVKNETFVLRRFVAFTGDIQVANLRPEHVEAFFYGPNGVMSRHKTRDGLDREPVKSSTHNYYRSRLKAFFTYCRERGLTRASLLSQVTPMRVEVLNRLQPSRDVLWAMLDSTDCPRARALLATAMNTGLRAESISDLRVGDVDLDTLSLGVRVQKSKLEDTLPLTADLAAELQRWLTTYRTTLIESDKKIEVLDEHYLFPSQTGPRYRWRTECDGRRTQYQVNGQWNPTRPARKIHEIVQDALAAVGLPTKHEGLHTVRRAVARIYFDELVASGKYDDALRMTSSLLHHSNTSTTERYLGLAKERLSRDVSLRGKSLLGPRPTAGAVRDIGEARGQRKSG